ncbi:MAG: GNAT family N-acetyltransferase [Tissierellia bacterium]|nr:GNAT family N-acetyltransferase [Tissierellia bacterium]
MLDYRIQETQDYLQFEDLFKSSDLEFHLDESGLQPEGSLGGFACLGPEGEILAGAVITQRDGYFILNDIAVREDLRGQGLGQVLLEKSLDKIRDLGGQSVYITAKAPGFFKKYDFVFLSPEETPDIFSCLDCNRYEEDCFPEFMMRDL